MNKKLELQIIPSGRIDYCGACKKDHGYECPLDWRENEQEAWYKFNENEENRTMENALVFWLPRMKAVQKEKSKEVTTAALVGFEQGKKIGHIEGRQLLEAELRLLNEIYPNLSAAEILPIVGIVKDK